MPQYSWLTYSAARQQLAARLADSGNIFWSDVECGLYLIEALRTWNALTEIWNADFQFTPESAEVWYNLGEFNPNFGNSSPRLRTVTDAQLYTMMQYHLLEPATGTLPWTGTSQFSLSDLQNALQHRRDEVIQITGCNLDQLPPLNATPNTRRTQFPDTVLEPRRARFVTADSTFGNPFTMTREDQWAFAHSEPGYLQTSAIPQAWSVIAGPPLMMDVDTAPNVPGYYDVLYLESGPVFNPPAQTLMGVPDDWSWLPKWGALSDLLGRDSEATDRQRADYCLKRYEQGLQIMVESNWLLSATINNVPVDTPSVREMDAFSPEWQDDPNAWRCAVMAGMDFVAMCPIATSVPNALGLTLVGNAPIPVKDADFVQISRDDFDVVLDYAQVLASFKQGGIEFMSTKDLEKNFFTAAMANNQRLAKMGIFSDMLHSEGKRQDVNQPR